MGLGIIGILAMIFAAAAMSTLLLAAAVHIGCYVNAPVLTWFSDQIFHGAVMVMAFLCLLLHHYSLTPQFKWPPLSDWLKFSPVGLQRFVLLLNLYCLAVWLSPTASYSNITQSPVLPELWWLWRYSSVWMGVSACCFVLMIAVGRNPRFKIII